MIFYHQPHIRYDTHLDQEHYVFYPKYSWVYQERCNRRDKAKGFVLRRRDEWVNHKERKYAVVLLERSIDDAPDQEDAAGDLHEGCEEGCESPLADCRLPSIQDLF